MNAGNPQRSAGFSSMLARWETLAKAVSPFPPMKVPKFEAVRYGPWELFEQTGIMVRGYFGGFQPFPHNWALAKHSMREGTPLKQIWMSISPMELESQSHHVLAAKGKVLIGGGGMGVVAWNCAMKPEVESVEIIERDHRIIEMLVYMAKTFEWENWHKVSIIHGDILKLGPLPGKRWDVAIIDIWPTIGDTRLRKDMRKIVKMYPATEYAAWTMELDFVDWLSDSNIAPDDVRPEHWKQWSEAIGVPMIQPHPDMAKYALQAVEQVINY